MVFGALSGTEPNVSRDVLPCTIMRHCIAIAPPPQSDCDEERRQLYSDNLRSSIHADLFHSETTGTVWFLFFIGHISP